MCGSTEKHDKKTTRYRIVNTHTEWVYNIEKFTYTNLHTNARN